MKRLTVLLAVLAIGLASAKVILPAEETGPMTLNFVQGYRFDPLREQPALPAGLSATEPEGEYGYYIVQFPGPVRPEWKEAAGRAGVQLLWYLPHYAFIARVPTAQVDAVASLPEVRWLGRYQPAWKLHPGLVNATGLQTLIVVFHYPENEHQLLGELSALGATGFLPEFNRWNKSVRVEVDASAIPAIAGLEGVHWVEHWGEITPDNRDVQWVCQQGYSPTDTTRVAWRKGVTGSSVYVGLTDNRLWLDHDAFRDPTNNTPGPGHRKVIHYLGTQGANSHGTHTGGTLCGDDEPVGGTSWHDGLAKHSRLYFQFYSAFPSGWDMNVWFAGPESGGPTGLRALNHSMSLSRKDTFNIYVFSDMTADQFVWNHPEFLHCNSMGNYGNNRMGHPVMAKSIISTGSTENGTSCRTLSSFSSRGPTADGRLKPQLVAPGSDVYSSSHNNASGYVSLSGTSMATPNMTAATALIRDYFRMGYYPTGDTTTGTPMEISAALNKAVATAGAAANITGFTVPDNNIGWGRINLDTSLHFAGDDGKLWVVDEAPGLETGDSAVYTIDVSDDAHPLRVALCWSDYPGTMQASIILVNDLNLTVVSPSGTEYKGNVYTGGQSQPGGSYDALNVEECVRVNTPETGTWTVKVHALNVPEGPQPFALAVIGMLDAAAPRHDVGVRQILAPVGQVDVDSIIIPQAIVTSASTVNETFDVLMRIGTAWADTQSITLTPGQIDTVSFADWTAGPLGWHTVACSTMLAGDQNPANDMQTDSVEVIPGTGVAEGGTRPVRFALDSPTPNPFSRSTSVRYSIPRAGQARLAVYTAAGTLVRTIVAGEVQPGHYRATWHGRDSRGRTVSSGVYLLRLEAGDETATRKLVLE